METMNRYPLDKFPSISMRPELVAKHEEHFEVLSKDIEKYTKIGYRNESLFDWVLRLFENLGLSTIKIEYLDRLVVTKTRLLIFTVLMDDPVDHASKRNFKLFDELIKIPFNLKDVNTSNFDSKDKEYIEYAKEIWTEIIEDVKSYPDYEKYREAFNFDIKQLLNSMEYAKFANTYPNGINLLENDSYIHHGMYVLVQTDLDLMCSKGFDDKELGMLRELSFISGKIAKISNLTRTYPRELLESDMSSEALVKFQKEHGENFKFKVNKLLNIESRYPKFEEILIQEYREKRALAEEITKKIKSIDVQRFLKERDLIQEAYQIKADYW